MIFIVFKFVFNFAKGTSRTGKKLWQSVVTSRTGKKLWQSVVMQFIRAFAKRPYITYPKITFNYSLMSSKSNCFFIKSVFLTRIITSSPS